MDPARLRVTAIDHVGIAVADLEAAIAIYTGVLGGTVVHREINEEQGVDEAMIDFGVAGGTQIQLLAATREDSPIGRFLQRRGPGLQQLALRVENIDAALGAATAAEFPLVDASPRRGTNGSSVAFLHPAAAGGVLVELVQPAAEGSHHGTDHR